MTVTEMLTPFRAKGTVFISHSSQEIIKLASDDASNATLQGLAVAAYGRLAIANAAAAMTSFF